MPKESRGGKRSGTDPLIPNYGTKCKSVINITPRPQYPLGKSPGTQCTGDLVSPRAGLDGYGEEKNFLPSPAFEHRTIHYDASRYTDYAIPVDISTTHL